MAGARASSRRELRGTASQQGDSQEQSKGMGKRDRSGGGIWETRIAKRPPGALEAQEGVDKLSAVTFVAVVGSRSQQSRQLCTEFYQGTRRQHPQVQCPMCA